MLKRRTLSFFAVFVVIILSACSSSSSGNTENGKDDQVTLRFAWWGGEARSELYNEIIDIFESKHPHIKIEQEYSDFGPYWDKLATQTAGGNAPDILSMHLTRYMEYAARNQLLPLDDQDIDLSGFDENIKEIGKVDNETIMVSVGSGSRAYYYNKDLFERLNVEPPSFDMTWDEFAKVGAELKKSDSNIYLIDDEAGQLDGPFAFFLRQKGLDLYNENGELGFTKDLMIEHLQYWDELREAGIIPQADLSAEYSGKQHQESMIVEGITASVVAPANQMKIYQMYMNDELDIGRVMTDPNGEAGEDIGGVYFSIYKNSKHPKEAAEFIDFWVNDQDAAKLFLAELGPIHNQNTIDVIRPLLPEADQKVMDYQADINQYIKVPVTPPTGNNEISDLFSQANEAVAFGQMTIEEAVDNFFNEANNILK